MREIAEFINLTFTPIWSVVLLLLGIVSVIPHVRSELCDAWQREKQAVCCLFFIAILFLVIIAWPPRYYRIHMDEAYYAQMALNFKWHFKSGINFVGDWFSGEYAPPPLMQYQQHSLGAVLMSFLLSISPVYPGHILNIMIGGWFVVILICFLKKTEHPLVVKCALLLSTLFLFEMVFWFRSGALEPLAATTILLLLYLLSDYHNIRGRYREAGIVALLGALLYTKAEMLVLAPFVAVIFLSMLQTNKERIKYGALLVVAWLPGIFHFYTLQGHSWKAADPHGTFSFFYFKRHIALNAKYLMDYGPGHTLSIFFFFLVFLSFFHLIFIRRRSFRKRFYGDNISGKTLCALGLFLLSTVVLYHSFRAGRFTMFRIGHRYFVPQYITLIGSFLFLSGSGILAERTRPYLNVFLVLYCLFILLEFPGALSKSFAPLPNHWWLRKDVEHMREIANDMENVSDPDKGSAIVAAIPQLAVLMGIGSADIGCLFDDGCLKTLCERYSAVYVYSGPWTPSGPIADNTWGPEKYGFSTVYERKIQHRTFRLWKRQCF